MKMKALSSIFGGGLLGVTVLGGGTYLPVSHWAEQKINQMEPNTVNMDVPCIQDGRVVNVSKEFKGYGKARLVEGCNTPDRVHFESDDVKESAQRTTNLAFIFGCAGGLVGGAIFADKKGWNGWFD